MSWPPVAGHGELAREFGLQIPLMGGKGYSMVIDPLTPQPQRPIVGGKEDRNYALNKILFEWEEPGVGEPRFFNFIKTGSSNHKGILANFCQFQIVSQKISWIPVRRGLRPCTPTVSL